MPARLVIVPQLRDNYAYLVIDPDGVAAVIDPAEAAVVLEAAARERAEIALVLSTHHHADHVGGNLELAGAIAGLRVAGHDQRIPGLTEVVQDYDFITAGTLRFQARLVPCHTRGHLAYLWDEALFAGDTMFAAGCGRFFEGTAHDMYRALYSTFGALLGTTKLYPGHEYTVKNLEFAASLEPTRPAVIAKLREARDLRARGLPTVPTTLDEERRYNPFLRVFERDLRAAIVAKLPELADADPIELLGGLRALKDRF